MASVTVLIVNYKAADLILRNLPNLTPEKQGVEQLDIVIVENNSPDDSFDVLRDGINDLGWQDRVELISSPVNGGFAAGNNIGLRSIYARAEQPDAVFFLNPDTRLDALACREMYDLFQSDGAIGVVGARLEDEDGSPRASCFHFPTMAKEVQMSLPFATRLGLKHSYTLDAKSNSAIRVDWVSGAAFMVRREALNDVRHLDDAYFLYFEEIDFMLSLTQAGWLIFHQPTARCVHYAGVSTGVRGGRALGGPMPDYWYKSWRRYFQKNFGAGYASITALGKLVGLTLSTFKNRLRGEAVEGLVSPRRFLFMCVLGSGGKKNV